MLAMGLWPPGLGDRGVDRCTARSPGPVETSVLPVHGDGADTSTWLPVLRYLHEAGFGRVQALDHDPLSDDLAGRAEHCAARAEEPEDHVGPTRLRRARWARPRARRSSDPTRLPCPWCATAPVRYPCASSPTTATSTSSCRHAGAARPRRLRTGPYPYMPQAPGRLPNHTPVDGFNPGPPAIHRVVPLLPHRPSLVGSAGGERAAARATDGAGVSGRFWQDDVCLGADSGCGSAVGPSRSPFAPDLFARAAARTSRRPRTPRETRRASVDSYVITMV